MCKPYQTQRMQNLWATRTFGRAGLSFVLVHYWISWLSKSKPEQQLRGRKTEEWISSHPQLLPGRICCNNSTGLATEKAVRAAAQQCDHKAEHCTGDSGKPCPHSLGQREQICEQKAAMGLQVEHPRSWAAAGHPCQKEKKMVMEWLPVKPTGLPCGSYGNWGGAKGSQPLNPSAWSLKISLFLFKYQSSSFNSFCSWLG